MGEIKGFLKYKREDFEKEPAASRINHFNEFVNRLPDGKLKEQGARCMDCGVPFCHSACPVNNIIPDWNDLVYQDKWKFAFEQLMLTNNFPEFTGRICPAPCESSCVLAINQPAVTIRNIELAIIERAYSEGWMKPQPPKTRTGRKAAVVGSGPSGLACADQLNKAGIAVTVFEKNDKPGGLLVYGIPDFKLSKEIVKRRIDLMKAEGIEFRTGVNIGTDITLKELKKKFDAVVLCGGAEQPRDLPVPGRGLDGIWFAMQFLSQQNRVNAGEEIDPLKLINAKGKKVVVLGGGDTGSDCIGTAIRQGAKSVKNFELLPRPPKERPSENPWPQWPLTEKFSTSHEEGCEREYSVLTKSFSGEQGKVRKLHCVRVSFDTLDPKTGRPVMSEIPGSEFEVKADLVLLAMGFTGPAKTPLLSELNGGVDERGMIRTNNNFMLSTPGIFTAGDMRRGQSLIVWAINEGRTAAKNVITYLA